MHFRLIIAAILAFSILSSGVYADPDTNLIKEIMECPEEEVISVSRSYEYIEVLKSMGYYKNDYKDDYINLRNAVLRFQSDCNLPADGIQGPIFKSAMLKRLMMGSMFRSPDIIARAPSKGHWITINRTNRILTLYRGKTVIRKYPIAIGRESHRTPQGKFHVYLKRKNPMWSGGRNAKPVAGGSPKNPLGNRWIGLSPGKGNIYGIHGNNSPYSIGHRVSKGCIRMINSDVLSLYSIIQIGAPVWIGDDNTLRKWGVTQKSFH
ncbi:MAG TPA: L,D-transpeptidase family protein [Clostridia bacterium]|nr:L,D-transpeptidase family protein [Clostridia bacterium]